MTPASAAARLQYRSVTFDRKLDVKRLRVALARTTREALRDLRPDSAPIRVRSVLVEEDRTTVVVTGNGPGLDVLTAAVRRSFPEARVARAARRDVFRFPGGGVPKPGERARKRRSG